MALMRTFGSMSNEYLTPKLLTEELRKRMWFFMNVDHVEDWKNGNLVVPFEGNIATSVAFNSFTASNDIAEADFVRGSVPTQVKATHSLIFNSEDLNEHDGKIPETTFLDVMPRVVGPGMRHFKEVLSHQFIGGPAICSATSAADAATGKYVVDRVERLNLKQKVMIKDDDTAAQAVYVKSINLNTNEVVFSATRGGDAANLAAYATNVKFYHPGGENGTFTSMKSALLSAANGGASTLHGQTKLSYPYLQCINKSGSDITSSNILEKLFDFYLDVNKKSRGNANQLLVSLKHWGSIMKSQQISKGGYKVINDPKKAEFGWWTTSIAQLSTGQTLDIVAVDEFDDDCITAFDKGSVKIYSNGGVRKQKTPKGDDFFVVRNTTGYQYIMDVIFAGEVVWLAPTRNGILHSISY